MKINLDTWIISDTHFYHDNIVKFCNRPINHVEIMYWNWREWIYDDDVVLHLGDLFMGPQSRQKFEILLPNLTGDKYMIRGNHDKQTDAWYERYGFKMVGDLLGTFVEEDINKNTGQPYRNVVKNYGFYDTVNGLRVLFSHYPDTWLLDWEINIHGHIHNNLPSEAVRKSSKDHRNVSVEVMDYKPKRLRDIIL